MYVENKNAAVPINIMFAWLDSVDCLSSCSVTHSVSPIVFFESGFVGQRYCDGQTFCIKY